MYVLSFYSLRSSKIFLFGGGSSRKQSKSYYRQLKSETAQNYFDFLCYFFKAASARDFFSILCQNKRENWIFRVWEIFSTFVVVVCVILDSPNISPDFYSISIAFNPRELFCMVENYAFSRLINHKQQKRATSLNQSEAMRKNFHFSQWDFFIHLLPFIAFFVVTFRFLK